MIPYRKGCVIMKKIDNKYIRRIVYSIQFLMSIVLLSTMYFIRFVPMKYMMIVGIILIALMVGEYFLIFYKKQGSKRSLLTQFLSLVLSCLMAVASFYVYRTGQVVDLLGDEQFQTRAISVIVLKDSPIKNEYQLPEHLLSHVSYVDESTMDYTVSQIEKEVGQISLDDSSDFHQLVTKLYQKDVDAIILDEAFRSLVEQEKESFSDDTRVIFQVKRDEAAVNAKSVDVTEKPFLVYISGNDEYGDLTAVSRSDVNMLVGINPTTKQILLISIPRDIYYPLHRNGEYDKFTHTGMYGLQESIDTLTDMVDQDINYYVRMNFTSFMDIVDALGGVTVHSPEEFTTKIGGYQIQEGENHLNAKEALAFVRERKSFVDGDFARGRNQQRMISAIVKKVCSPAILTSFSQVLDTISQSIETNMPSDEMNALVQMQLSQMPNWDIQSYQIIGDSASMPCYSVGMNASVIIPNEFSITQACEYIDQFMDNEKIETELGDLEQ